MSATFNWAYRPGVTNKYGIDVTASADGVRPLYFVYIALYGNDFTGNGSRMYPFRTIDKATTVLENGGCFIFGAGVYRLTAPIVVNSYHQYVGDGDVTIDFSYVKYFSNQAGLGWSFCNLRLKGNGIDSRVTSSYGNGFQVIDVIFDGCISNDNEQSGSNFTNCQFINYYSRLYIQPQGIPIYTNCTFSNCNNLVIAALGGNIRSCIFYFCNVSFDRGITGNPLTYSLFFSCNFCIGSNGGAGGLYPTTPAGYTYYSDINTFIANYIAVYGANPFTGCYIGDPLFNNPNIQDYTLAFNSPAKNLSFFGTYVGASSIAYAVKASATEATGSFDFDTNVNLIITDDSIVLDDITQPAEIKTKLILNEFSRQINKFPIYGFNADRNGQYIDSIADLDITPKTPADALAAGSPYLVENAGITYNGVVYLSGDRFTTVAGVTSFTSASGGTCREILEAPQRHTIMARFSDGGVTIAAGAALTADYWYFVNTGSVTYNAVVYNAGEAFKATGSTGFTGTGVVIIAFDTQVFNHYEPGIQPTSNNVGDSRTGDIIRGNGDPSYNRGGYGVTEFPINARFIQLYYIINVSNLKP